jgi:excisionase family DNA binding protein
MTYDSGYKRTGIRERLADFDRALTADEVAGLLGISAQMIRKQARTGDIPCFRIGTSVRFDPQKLCEWLERQTIDLYGSSRRKTGKV